MEIKMIRYFCVLLFIFNTSIQAHNNSKYYVDKLLVRIHSNNQNLVDSLLKFNVIPLSCRGYVLESELIIDNKIKRWLEDNNISFSIIHDDVEAMIKSEMDNINLLKSQRSSDFFSVYRDLDEIEEKINSIVNASNVVTKEVIGQSYEGRDIMSIKISVDNDIENKPAIFINGCQHAREWITPMSTTYLIETLSNDYDLDINVNMLLNAVDVYIVPIVNPDGYVYTWEENRWWRKNRQLNVGSNCVGTDLNRNWDIDWNGEESTSEDPCSYIYVGTSPFSAPETQIVSDYMSSIPNLVSHIDIHSYSALIIGPWGFVDEFTEDNDEIFCLGTNMQAAVSNTHDYPYIFGVGSVNDLLYLVSGAMIDWVYNSFSSLSYLYELRPVNLYAFDPYFDGLSAFDNEPEEIIPTCEEFYQGFLEMLQYAYLDNCEVPTGCSDPLADNYYCNTPEGNMRCLYLPYFDVNSQSLLQENGAYNVFAYSLPLGFIDDGSCTYLNDVETLNRRNVLIKITDILGRENHSNGFGIAIYDDGSIEKIYIK